MNLWIVIAFFVLLLPVWVRLYTQQIQRSRIITTVLLLLLGVMLVGCFSDSAPESPELRPEVNNSIDGKVNVRPVNTERSPVVEASDSYVGSSYCIKCHADQHASWDESYHQSMTQLPSKETVLGDFNDVTLQLDGVTYRLEYDDDGYWVETNLGDGLTRLPIKLLTGSHHMQLYWFALPDSVPPEGPKRILGLMPFSYLVSEKAWVPRRSTFLHPPVQSENFEVGRWNATCLRCHSTHPKADYFGKENPLTTVAEFGISCEACHGPGKAHVDFYESEKEPQVRGLHQIVNPLELDHRRASHVCANCHGATSVKQRGDAQAWHEQGNSFRPGDDLLEHRHLIRATRPTEAMTAELLQHDPTLFESVFWADGMVRVTGREYSGLVESACHLEGKLSCLSCHTMHNDGAAERSADDPWNDDQLRVGMRSNKACIDCHRDYTGLKLTQHTHHLGASQGSKCYNCHMPHTSYGLLKAARSHQISNPSVPETLLVGRQNACNNCHIDKTLQWTADHLHEWYGHEKKELPDAHQKISSVVLALLAGDAGQRALAAWALSWEPALEASGRTWQGSILAYGLNDPYDAPRWMAVNSLKKLESSIDSKLTAQLSETEAEAIRLMLVTRAEVERPTQNVLRKQDGSLDMSLLEFLLKQRNERRMYLQE